MLNQKPGLWGGILFVAGTSMGAGMLALPVVTAAYGFWPSTFLFIGSWFFMLLAALFMLEANLWSAVESNLISMARNTLGGLGEILTWIFYLLLLYVLMAAYLAGIDSILKNFLNNFFHINLSFHCGILLLLLCAVFIIYLGAHAMDYLNRFLVCGIIASYFLLVLFILPHLQLSQLMTGSLRHACLVLPVVMCSFGFQIIVPTLRVYLNSDVQAIKRAIMIGSGIPLLAYILWEALILGVLPLQGAGGLLAILKAGQPAVDLAQALQHLLDNSLLTAGANCFAFFAITTSFIGASLSLFDFLSDGLKKARFFSGRLSIILLTALPPVLFVLLYPRGFILALGYAGTIVAILLGILPVLMVWRGRYVLKIAGPSNYRVLGGRVSLVAVLLFSLTIIFIEFLHK